MARRIAMLDDILHDMSSTAKRGGKKLGARSKLGSLAQERKLHMQEMEKLDREIPLPNEKTRGFVFRR